MTWKPSWTSLHSVYGLQCSVEQTLVPDRHENNEQEDEYYIERKKTSNLERTKFKQSSQMDS